MSPSKEVIALTGASGSLGAVVLEHLINDGYTVNAVLRSLAKSRSFLEQKYPIAVSSGQLRFAEIADMTAPGSFDSVLASADRFIHVATPLSNDDFEDKLFKPATALMNNVLFAAKRSPTLKRIVITGSIVATLRVPDLLMSGKTISSKDFNDITRAQAGTTFLHAYQYSKVAAEIQAWDFMKIEKPDFDLVFMLSPFITGRSIQQGWRSNRIHPGGISGIYRSLFDVEAPTPIFSYFQDIDDVADMHIKSLDSAAVPGNARYLASAGYIDSSEMAARINEEFPELAGRVPKGTKSAGPPEKLFKLDLTETERIFGTKWKGAWESVRETVKDIIETERKYGVQPIPAGAAKQDGVA